MLTQQALRQMERDLAISDPRLNELFLDFARRAGRGTMPPAEKIRTLPRHWPDRLGKILRCAIALMAPAFVICLPGFRRGLPWVIPR